MSLILDGFGAPAAVGGLPTVGSLTTPLSLPRLALCELIAACPTFRQVVGALDSAGAMLHVFSPYADDVLEPGGDLDAAEHPIMRLKHPRPRALVNHAGMARNKEGTAYGGGNGNLLVDFEFLPDPAEIDPNVRLAVFEEQVGKILAEIEERIGQGKQPGETLYTNPDHTFPNLIRWELVAGPGECLPREEQGEIFLGATFEVEWM